MILRSFPGTDYQAPETRRLLSLFGQETIIIHALTDQIAFAQHTAPLSIKTTFQGCERYEINGHPVVVDQHSYLVINQDQPYASSIESIAPVESFCVFFRDDLTQEVLSVFCKQAAWLVDHPESQDTQPPELFFQYRRPVDHLISPILANIHQRIQTNEITQSWLDEQYHFLIERLLQQHAHIQQEIEKLPMVRRSTRVELFKRLFRARDFIESCYAEPISLTDMAGAACLPASRPDRRGNRRRRRLRATRRGPRRPLPPDPDFRFPTFSGLDLPGRSNQGAIESFLPGWHKNGTSP